MKKKARNFAQRVFEKSKLEVSVYPILAVCQTNSEKTDPLSQRNQDYPYIGRIPVKIKI